MTRPPKHDAEPAASHRVGERTLLVATAAFLLVAPFAASSGLRTVLLMLAIAALALGGRRALSERVQGLPIGVVAAYAAWAFFALASLAWSVRPDYTVGELRGEIVYATMAFAAYLLASSDATHWRRWWIALVAGTALAWAGQGLQEGLGIRLSRHAIEGGPGPFSTHLVLLAPLLLAFAWDPPFGIRRSAAGLAIAVVALLAAAWSTGNRIIWAAFVAASLAAVVAARKAQRADARQLRRMRIAMAMAGITMALAFAASVLDRNERFHRGDPAAASLDRDVRPRIWAAAWERLREAPWIGHGFGREIVEDAFLPHTPRGRDHPPLRHAHNTFLDIALSLGVAGLALFAVLLFTMAREYWRYLSLPAFAPLGVMGLALLAGFVVKNLTDDFFFRHNGLVFWAINGMLLGLGRPARRREGAP